VQVSDALVKVARAGSTLTIFAVTSRRPVWRLHAASVAALASVKLGSGVAVVDIVGARANRRVANANIVPTVRERRLTLVIMHYP
jgi:hypothetical protein